MSYARREVSLGQTLRLIQEWQDAMCGTDGPAARRLSAQCVNLDLTARLAEAAQHAQTLRDMINPMHGPDYQLRAVADWLAQTGEK